MHHIDAVVTPLIKQGQSPYMILTNHPELGISVKTLYNYIEQGHLLTRNVDLKRKTKFKPRKSIKHRLQTGRSFWEGPIPISQRWGFHALNSLRWIRYYPQKALSNVSLPYIFLIQSCFLHIS